MNQRLTWNRNAQLVAVLSCAAALKLYYSTASVNQLRWILAPTTVLVELVSGTRFAFESHAGYLSSDRSFLIAASCAGVNFLITAFLMVSLRKLWRHGWGTGSDSLAWRFIPTAAVLAYLVTIVANGIRISIALYLKRMSQEVNWLTPNQLHRFEGIFVYFGFLLLLFVVSEKLSSENTASLSPHGTSPRGYSGPELPSHRRFERGKTALFRASFFPLLLYYVTTLGIPLVYSAFRPRAAIADFWEHSLFVLVTPLLLILPVAACCFHGDQRKHSR
jgi:exosortase K